MRFLFPFLVVVALVFGAAHAAAILNAVMGPWSAVGILQDGSQTHMQFGTHLPRPDWLKIYPGATIVGAGKITSAEAPYGFHSLDLATRASADEVKRFYADALTAEGFSVEDLGLMSLNPQTAALLGIAGALSAKRAASDDRFDMQIRTADGLLPSRLLQIHWRKISEAPAQQ